MTGDMTIIVATPSPAYEYPFISPSAEEMRAGIRELPSYLLDQLATGEVPEPGCGVCHVLGGSASYHLWGHPAGPPGPAWLVTDYHCAPRRDRTDLPMEERGRLDYLRCLEIYEEARLELAARVYGSAARSDGMGV